MEFLPDAVGGEVAAVSEFAASEINIRFAAHGSCVTLQLN